jgi:hypothetical protein
LVIYATVLCKLYLIPAVVASDIDSQAQGRAGQVGVSCLRSGW